MSYEDSNISDFSQHGRFALAFAHVAVHASNQQEALVTAGDVHDYVQDIINESANEWDALLKHPFPYDLAKGATPLNGFRHYMIQDATHFEYFYRARMEALPKSGTFKDLEDFAKILPGGLRAVASGRTECTSKLGVLKDVVDSEPKSHQLEEFIEFVASVANKGDYIDAIIALLPGVLAYNIITNKLVRDPETVRNTVYWNLLIEPWSKIPAAKQRDNTNKLISGLPEEERKKRLPGWVANFKKGCKYEVDFSGLATPGQFPAYYVRDGEKKDVHNGLYKIRSYRVGNPYLVSNEPPSVTTQETPPQEDGTWRLTNTPDGYSVENVKAKGFLHTIIQEPLQPAYGVSISPEDYHWSINAVDVKGQNGNLTVYQLLVPGKLQYVLDAGNNPGDHKVYVSNNAGISSQFWLLDPFVLDG